MSNSLAVACARVRMPLLWAGLGLGAAGLWVPVPEWLPVALLAIGMALYLRVGRINGEPITVAPPVAGRWLAINSPGNRVPSHGLHAYGQTYAVDLVTIRQTPAGRRSAGPRSPRPPTSSSPSDNRSSRLLTAWWCGCTTASATTAAATRGPPCCSC